MHHAVRKILFVIQPVDSPRGSIRDVQGNLLATNRPVTTVYWQGTGNATLISDQLEILTTIENITGSCSYIRITL